MVLRRAFVIENDSTRSCDAARIGHRNRSLITVLQDNQRAGNLRVDAQLKMLNGESLDRPLLPVQPPTWRSSGATLPSAPAAAP